MVTFTKTGLAGIWSGPCRLTMRNYEKPGFFDLPPDFLASRGEFLAT